jgi:hypothetical protein
MWFALCGILLMGLFLIGMQFIPKIMSKKGK